MIISDTTGDPFVTMIDYIYYIDQSSITYEFEIDREVTVPPLNPSAFNFGLSNQIFDTGFYRLQGSLHLSINKTIITSDNTMLWYLHNNFDHQWTGSSEMMLRFQSTDILPIVHVSIPDLAGFVAGVPGSVVLQHSKKRDTLALFSALETFAEDGPITALLNNPGQLLDALDGAMKRFLDLLFAPLSATKLPMLANALS